MSDEMLPLGAEEPATDDARTLSVRELVDEINGALRDRFSDGVWVTGEISGYNKAASGHVFFDLVEERDGQRAVISVALWAGQQARLRNLLLANNLRMANGLKVRIFGTIDMYAATGRLSLKMSGIDPRFTLGDLAVRRDEILRRLRESGLIDANRQTHMPAVPLNIGLVTSRKSAAFADFTAELDKYDVGFHVSAVNVLVQGDTAPAMIAAAIAYLGGRHDIDIVVLIRGGGAKNDLAAFDTEQVAMAIAQCPKPVITGIGHEVDHHIADDVAFEHYKTPTAVAVALLERVWAYAEAADDAWDGIVSLVASALEQSSVRLGQVAQRISTDTARAVERSATRLDASAKYLAQRVGALLAVAEGSVVSARAQLAGSSRRHVELASSRLDNIDTHVRLMDPAHTLARGWSITRTADGRVVRSVSAVAAGAALVTTVADGTIASTATDATTSNTNQSGYSTPSEDTP